MPTAAPRRLQPREEAVPAMPKWHEHSPAIERRLMQHAHQCDNAARFLRRLGQRQKDGISLS
jgi:hypothetical protein